MSEASNYLENKLLNHFLRVSSYTQPSGLYLALFTSAPTDAGGGTEISGGGYARQSISFTTSTAGTSANTAQIEFSNTSWSGTVVAVAIYDALTGGNLMTYTGISPSIVVASGEAVVATAGSITVLCD